MTVQLIHPSSQSCRRLTTELCALHPPPSEWLKPTLLSIAPPPPPCRRPRCQSVFHKCSLFSLSFSHTPLSRAKPHFCLYRCFVVVVDVVLMISYHAHSLRCHLQVKPNPNRASTLQYLLLQFLHSKVDSSLNRPLFISLPFPRIEGPRTKINRRLN